MSDENWVKSDELWKKNNKKKKKNETAPEYFGFGIPIPLFQ